MQRYDLRHLDDEHLMAGLARVMREHHQRTAELLAHLAEVDARRLYLQHAASSLFAYCVEVLGFAEDVAYKRITAARTCRAYPAAHELVARGEVNVSGLVLLSPHLRPDNHLALLERARGKSKRAIEELLAETLPRADVPTTLRKVPEGRVAAVTGLFAGAASREAGTPAAQPTSTLGPTPSANALSAANATPPAPGLSHATAAPRERAQLEPLSATRYRLGITVSRATRDRLLQAQALLAHARRGCDLATVVELAVEEYVDRLERRRFGKRRDRAVRERSAAIAAPTSNAAEQPAPGRVPPVAPVSDSTGQLAPGRVASDASASDATEQLAPGRIDAQTGGAVGRDRGRAARSRYVPAAVRRAVADRDGHRCTFVGPDGRRCASRYRLELHHVRNFAHGGGHTADNLALRCAAHNAHQARLDFGEELVRRKVAERGGEAG